MKLTIDTNKKKLAIQKGKSEKTFPLYSRQSFELISDAWVKVGWNEKYPYTFSWMGRPVIQLPEDMIRTQEVIHRVKPDVILETGVAHGGSLIYYASLCKAMGQGRVIGIDIEIRPHNRKAIEAHALFPWITLIEGSSTSKKIVQKAKSMIGPKETVLVLLDSNHTRSHVRKELALYSPFVTKGSYIVATDGVMNRVPDVPRGKSSWSHDNPEEAALDFLKKHRNFVLEQPRWPFNESRLRKNITHWPGAWLRRK